MYAKVCLITSKPHLFVLHSSVPLPTWFPFAQESQTCLQYGMRIGRYIKDGRILCNSQRARIKSSQEFAELCTRSGTLECTT